MESGGKFDELDKTNLLIDLFLDRHVCRSFNKLHICHSIGKQNRIGTSSAVDRGFEPQSGQTKHYKIGICCFSAKHAALRRKSKDWLAWNQNNVSEWSDISTRGLLFQ
jgi:hypothetical protein